MGLGEALENQLYGTVLHYLEGDKMGSNPGSCIVDFFVSFHVSSSCGQLQIQRSLCSSSKPPQAENNFLPPSLIAKLHGSLQPGPSILSASPAGCRWVRLTVPIPGRGTSLPSCPLRAPHWVRNPRCSHRGGGVSYISPLPLSSSSTRTTSTVSGVIKIPSPQLQESPQVQIPSCRVHQV